MAAMLLAPLLRAAETVSDQGPELPAPPLVIGLGALGAFVVLLGITWAFRNVGHKH